MAELLGTHSYSLDPKGRVSLPARFRDAFADGVWLTIGQDGCLFCFPRVEWERRSDEVASSPLSDADGRAYSRMFFGRSDEAKLDGQGRVTIPQRLREAVGINKEVVVLGVRDRMEIWDREAYDRYMERFAAAYQAGDLDPRRIMTPNKLERGPSEPAHRHDRTHPAGLHRHRRARRPHRVTVADAPHDPVMVREVIGFLGGRGTVVDMTLGAGGHAEALLSAGVGRLVGVDRDPTALAVAGERLAIFGERFHPVRARFSEIDEEVVDGPVDGVLFDLGVSSMQLDRPERGFSYRQDGPLDMRMGDTGPTAADLVNELPEKELADLIFEYGQETKSRRTPPPSSAPLARADRRHGRAGRHRRERRGTTSGGPPPRASDVPGAPHRGQPGDRGARRLPASGGRPPRSRRPRGRARLPLVGGPGREADVPRRGTPVDPHEEAPAAVPGGDRVEPARAEREAARRRAVEEAADPRA